MSTFFNLKVPTKEKEVSHHPWENIIKDQYSNKIKTAHNSINNPHYPVKKEKPVDKDRVKFTVIGNRVTEEFIYCVNLVRGLHTYRKKRFESPVIRGVTSVEWPLVWNDLKIQYGGLAYCLSSQVAVLINDKILGGEKELKELIDTKYTYHLVLDYCKESVKQFANFIKGSSRPCAYMHISINSKHIGTMIFMLYVDVAPFTCENFLRLCKETKGGYGGTPIHRIVKDGWIQCGGFGLKDTKFYCENFIIPPDRRGVLCMANAGRHVECSTQFFVLLQPAPWMTHKYVAFGQLIDGESTLQKIEKVETWYESPTSKIEIYKVGILNLDCHDIMINRGAKEYIHSHIEDLITLGELFLEELMAKVFLEIEAREIARELKAAELAAAEEDKTDLNAGGLHATQRFMHKKPEEEKLTDKKVIDQKSLKPKSPADTQSTKGQVDQKSPKVDPRQSEVQPSSAASKHESENNAFDVSEYDYEPEEYSYQHVTPPGTESIIVKPEKPYYIELTDVPYPGEVSSEYDLKKFLRGDYCLESDLKVTQPELHSAVVHKLVTYPSEVFNVSLDSVDSSQPSLESEEEKEIQRYLRLNTDRVSFAGTVIRNIARGDARHNIFASPRKSDLVTDEELRRVRIASTNDRLRGDSFTKKVSISIPIEEFKAVHKEIKRRQTGFVRPADLEKVHIINKTSSLVLDEDAMVSRKVRIHPEVMTPSPKVPRRPTMFVGASPTPASSEVEVKRHSVLAHLYEENQYDDEELPTLKDYKRHVSNGTNKNIILTKSTHLGMVSEDHMDHYRRGLAPTEKQSVEEVTCKQRRGKGPRKVSSGLVKSIEQACPPHETTLRSIEFAKTRPSLSVSEYQARNKKYKEINNASNNNDKVGEHV